MLLLSPLWKSQLKKNMHPLTSPTEFSSSSSKNGFESELRRVQKTCRKCPLKKICIREEPGISPFGHGHNRLAFLATRGDDPTCLVRTELGYKLKTESQLRHYADTIAGRIEALENKRSKLNNVKVYNETVYSFIRRPDPKV